ncbi:MaoC family dehydratase [Megasphaera paucivorans]|uniref:MaoC family dehydratase n=1 Tax=Megasphaera paucivorans TaxID=349095 RepID=UPI003CEFF094
MSEEKTYEEMQIGDKTSFGKTISEGDVYAFAGITGDFNPVHVNEVEAGKTMFKGRIAHGMLSAGIISATMTRAAQGGLPIYCSQELAFKAPVRIGDTITCTAELIGKIPEKHRLIFQTTVVNQDGVVVTDGKAVMLKK